MVTRMMKNCLLLDTILMVDESNISHSYSDW